MIDILREPQRRNKFGSVSGEKGFGRLYRARDASYKKLHPFRRVFRDLVDSYTGGSYGDGSQSGSRPLNLLELAISTYQRKLASHTPRVLIHSDSLTLKPVAREMQIAVNYVIDRQLNLGSRLNEWVIDALFAMGIMKVGEISPFHPSASNGYGRDAQIYAETILLADWVHDMTARRFDEVEYCGHIYQMSIEDVMDNPDFSKEGKEAAWSSIKQSGSQLGIALADSESPEDLTNQGTFAQDDYTDKVNLWEMYLPAGSENREPLVVVSLVEGDEEPLFVGEPKVPDDGPYQLLGFSPVPGNIMPVAPAMLWEDIGDLINRLFLKAGDQADRQRTILAGRNNTVNAMEAIIQTADGETVLTDVSPEQIKEFRFGGVDGGLMATIMQFKDLFSYQAGNLDSLGGLDATTQTIGQDRMLSQSASERLADMQERVVKATTNVIRKIAWYLWNNEEIDLPLNKPILPTISRDFHWNKYSRDGEFFDYNFRIIPHSLQSKSPQERAQTMMMVVNQTILPMLPSLQEQGITFDMFKYLEKIAELTDTSELNELIRDNMGQMLNQRQTIDPQSSPVTQRNYTRQSIPGSSTSQGRNQDAIQQFQQMGKQQMGQQTNQGMMPGRGRPPASR